jgi:hypothetical protein
MGLADAVVTQLFAARRRSDLEMQLSMILERKLAVQDKCNEISAELSATIFQSDDNSDISGASAVPGFIPSSSGLVPELTTMAEDEYGTYEYEVELAELQQVEKQLDTQQKKMETELEAIKAEEESFEKIAQDHAKNDFKIGS